VRTALRLAALAVAVAGVLLLRAEVMTVHAAQPPGSHTTFVLDAATREDPRHLPEMTSSLVSVCRLLVNADVVERSFVPLGEGAFAFSVQPGLGEFDLREMRGCLEDTRVQHLLVDVRNAETVLP
jgi:hypothetical protein